jgi:photosystem II stability/assembly factor-like uncharacterized protein
MSFSFRTSERTLRITALLLLDLALVGCGGVSWETASPGFKGDNAPVAVRWSNTTPELRSIWGTDGNQIWTVGEGGTIFHTPDGGKHWETQESGTNESLTAVFGSGTELWAVGERGLRNTNVRRRQRSKGSSWRVPLNWRREVRGYLQKSLQWSECNEPRVR